MHRDFKLANILKHNGVIKIADFGFSKILGDDVMATTMLGSPLNMGPEILAGKDYNSKADIWSIGTCFYELLFGKPPYTANSIVDLLKKIHKNPFELPPGAKVSPQVEDVLKRMLRFNPEDRLEWEELFEHPIHRMQEAKIMRELEETSKNNDIVNVSRFYINNNKVIDNVFDIEKKTDINNYALALTKSNQPQNFTGNYINRQTKRVDEDPMGIGPQKPVVTEVGSSEALPSTETEREKIIRIFKQNSSRILHERNKYVFLASIAEDAINFGFKLSDLVVFVLIKKLFRMICEIKISLENNKNAFGLEMWNEYVLSKDFKKIGNYIFKEYELFKTYYENLNENLKKKFNSSEVKNPLIERLLKCATEEEINGILRKLLKEYVENIFSNGAEYNKRKKDILIHINQLADSLNADKVFYFEKNSRQFNFKLFYEEIKNLGIDEIYELVKGKMKEENIICP